MDITFPVGSWRHGAVGNTKTIAITGHTEADPYIAIFKRKPHNGDTYGYQVKVVKAHEDAETSVKKNQIIEINFRNIDFQNSVDAAAAYDVAAAIMADADLKDAALSTGRLPNDPA